MAATVPRRFDPDESLLVRAHLGDLEAFCALVHPHEPAVFTLAWALSASSREAENVAQEAVLKAWKHFGEYSESDGFRVWLLQFMFAEAKPSSGSLDLKAVDDYTPCNFDAWKELPPGSMNDPEFRDQFHRALLSLPPLCRVVLILRDSAGMTTAECAKVMRISISRAKRSLLRARLELRDRLASAVGNKKAHRTGGAR